MMSDVECPYCEKSLKICHDDGFGYEEDRYHEQECSGCGKTFTFTTSVHYYYEARKADCLNGEPHKLRPVTHYPRYYPDWVKCEDCEYEIRGQFREPGE